MASTGSDGLGDGQLRERLAHRPEVPQQVESIESAKQNVEELNGTHAKQGEEKEKKTYGRTPNGTIFTVPETHDMVSQLLSPSQPKNLSDLVILGVLAVLISLLVLLPGSVSIPFFALTFLFWRACYNAGIGYLLQIQSDDRMLVVWAKRSGLFEAPATGKNTHPRTYAWLKREMETKIPKDYKFEDAPIEYNTWLAFRRVVDLILMCDFVSYCCFAIACAQHPAGETWYITLGRWTGGIVLFMFNLWVKLDAHRVVKDYAWYWGDFFYLIDQELTFDGVFEMAPHPMYSVGYAGYYGISLMAASYKVLFISIIAHAAQFAFLTLVENPHIDKTYNAPPARTQEERIRNIIGKDGRGKSKFSTIKPSDIHKLLGLQNLDLHRVTDTSILLLQFYIFTSALLTPSTTFWQTLFILNAIFWRLWFSVGLAFILNRQSNKKSWTRHFIKYGDSTEEAWRQWKGFYHLSTTLCYASFIAASWKMYFLPENWSYGMVLLRHVVGAALIALHLWTIISIYESLGEFGWFYGDFFFDYAPKLTYSGIYRFLNNPERFLGLAGVWGFAIITWSKAIFLLAIMSHTLTLMFIQFVERPHMHRLYGKSIRQDSGVSKSIRRSLPPSVRAWQTSVDEILVDAGDWLENVIMQARSKISSDYVKVVNDSKQLFNPAKLQLTREAKDLDGFDRSQYGLTVEGTPNSGHAWLDRRSGREGEDARHPPVRTNSNFRPLIFEYGTPIRVRWTAPKNHGKKDWVGLYMISDTIDREVTRVSSRGRWVATTPGQYDSIRADAGIVSSDDPVPSKTRDGDNELLAGEQIFSGDKLWWTTGVFEFRYHHDGKHTVMSISHPFEIRVGRFDEDDVELDLSSLNASNSEAAAPMRHAVEQALLPIVQNCFDRDPDIAPSTVDESFGSLVERDGKFSRRVVFAVSHMFGIEFAPEVVMADGNVRNLAWRIFNAKKVLVSVILLIASLSSMIILTSIPRHPIRFRLPRELRRRARDFEGLTLKFV
jgi:phosphatidylethanolamine N-methyltransferase